MNAGNQFLGHIFTSMIQSELRGGGGQGAPQGGGGQALRGGARPEWPDRWILIADLSGSLVLGRDSRRAGSHAIGAARTGTRSGRCRGEVRLGTRCSDAEGSSNECGTLAGAVGDESFRSVRDSCIRVGILIILGARQFSDCSTVYDAYDDVLCG